MAPLSARLALSGPAVLAAGALAIVGACGGGGGEEPQYAVLVIVDTLRRDALSCYGNTRIETPHMDALAADGTRFDQAIASSGWTLPSVASILTGTWPSVHKAQGRVPLLTPITPDLVCAPEVLRAAGFHTIAYVNAAFLDPLLGLDRGFERFDQVDVYNARIRRSDETVRAALEALESAKSESTLLLVHVFDPHLNYDPPPSHAEGLADERFPPPPLSAESIDTLWASPTGPPPSPEAVEYVRRVYDADVAFVDEQVGVLVAGLKRMGVYDRATIVLTSDHGEEFWEHGGFEHGHTLHDELIHVPLIVKLPRELATDPRPAIEAQVRTLDIFPTVFAVAGVPQPPTFVGESLAPLILGQDSADRPAYSEGTLYGGDFVAWRTRKWKYLYDRDPEARVVEQLYDLQSDPGETRNLAADPDLADEKYGLSVQFDRFYTAVQELGATMTDPPGRDMSPAKNAEYLDWIKRMSELGYAGKEDR